MSNNNQTGLQKFNQTIQNVQTQNYINSVLGKKASSFMNNVTALVGNNASLQDCEPLTVLYSAMKATALDLPLDPNLGFAYVIPYKDNKNNRVVATFQIGYKGFKQLAIRSGQYKHIHSSDVRDGEIVKRDRLTGEIEFKFIENEVEREKAKIVGYVSYFQTNNGFSSTFYMSIDEVKKHATKYSQTYKKGYGNWVDDFEKMAKKTVTKLNLSSNGVLSVEMQDAIISDQSIIKENGVEYIDNQDAIMVSSEENQKAIDIVSDALNFDEEKKETK